MPNGTGEYGSLRSGHQLCCGGLAEAEVGPGLHHRPTALKAVRPAIGSLHNHPNLMP